MRVFLSAKLLALLTLGVICLIGTGACGGGTQVATRNTRQLKAENLQHTVVTAHLLEPHAAGKNLVWCATLQMAWDEAARHFGGTMPLTGTPLMGKTLDQHLVTAKDLDPNSYISLGGFHRDGILDQIPAAIAAKFGPDQTPSLLPDAPGNPDDLIAYAYLRKLLKFKTPFLPTTGEPLKFRGETAVKSFGLTPSDDTHNWSDIARQVRIWSYADDSDCIVELLTDSAGDRLVLARVTPGASLKDTIEAVVPKLQGPPTSMDSIDTLQVPVFDFNFLRNYDEVLNRAVTVPCRDTQSVQKQYVLSIAAQTIEFKLDEHGVVLKSEAVVGVAPGAGPPIMPKPKRLVFDQPFLILLLRLGSSVPYFALWVDNAELLQALQ